MKRIINWLTKNRLASLEAKVRALEEENDRGHDRYQKLLAENQQQRLLITALRDVNATLDTRCNEMEKRP
jgi:hypothetical protein